MGFLRASLGRGPIKLGAQFFTEIRTPSEGYTPNEISSTDETRTTDKIQAPSKIGTTNEILMLYEIPQPLRPITIIDGDHTGTRGVGGDCGFEGRNC